jgi:hypothetical protein
MTLQNLLHFSLSSVVLLALLATPATPSRGAFVDPTINFVENEDKLNYFTDPNVDTFINNAQVTVTDAPMNGKVVFTLLGSNAQFIDKEEFPIGDQTTFAYSYANQKGKQWADGNFQIKAEIVYNEDATLASDVLYFENRNSNPFANYNISDNAYTTPAAIDTYKYPTFEFLGDTLYASYVDSNGKILNNSTIKNFAQIGDGNKAIRYDDWSKPAANPKDTEYTTLPIATTVINDKLYQSHVGGNKIWTRSFTESSGWSRWTRDTDPDNLGEYTAFGVDMIAMGDKLFQVAVGKDNRTWTRSSTDGIKWSPWSNSNKGAEYTADEISMEVFKNKLYQTRVGKYNQVLIRNSSDGVTWTPWEWDETQTLEYTAHRIALTAFDGSLNQTAIGRDNKVWTRTYDGDKAFGTWKRDESVIGEYSNKPVVQMVSHGMLNQLVYGRNGQYYNRAISAASNPVGYTYYTNRYLPRVIY